MLPITATFLDEISHDIPHQNWGQQAWDQDFRYMQQMGIDTVVLIRSGYQKWLTYPSNILSLEESCFTPPIDLVDLFLALSEKYGFAFYFGLYDSGKYWCSEGNFEKEIDINLRVIEEVWEMYGARSAFKGWYICQEVSRKTKGIIDLYAKLGKHCKDVSGSLPTLISPYIDGTKAILASQSRLSKDNAISIKEHERVWCEIIDGIQESVDILAFQDGHVDYDHLPAYLEINHSLADRFGMQCWSNAETFDRDMPIKFLPIKWEKLLLKLKAAQLAGIEKAITFEFSHFMSPQSAYSQAHHLFDRYMEALSA